MPRLQRRAQVAARLPGKLSNFLAVTCVDPGVTTGVALLLVNFYEKHISWGGTTTKSYREYFDWYVGKRQQLGAFEHITVSENIVGQGPRYKDIKTAILFQGFAIGLAEAFDGTFILQPPQLRRSNLEFAKTIAKGEAIHTIDALAHGIAYLKRQKGVDFGEYARTRS